MKGLLYALLATAIPECMALVIKHDAALEPTAALDPRVVQDSTNEARTYVSTVAVTRIICGDETPTPSPSPILEQKEQIVEQPAPQSTAAATSEIPSPPPAAPTIPEPADPPIPTSDVPSAPPVAPAPPESSAPPSSPSPVPAPPPSNPPAGSLPLPDDTETIHTGELTYYDTGMGACGVLSTNNDAVVALSQELFDVYTPGGNPNKNTLCGRKIKIMYPQPSGPPKETVFTVVDRCTGCKPTDLDIPEPFHNSLVPNSAHIGRAKEMKWQWVP